MVHLYVHLYATVYIYMHHKLSSLKSNALAGRQLLWWCNPSADVKIWVWVRDYAYQSVAEQPTTEAETLVIAFVNMDAQIIDILHV